MCVCACVCVCGGLFRTQLCRLGMHENVGSIQMSLRNIVFC